MLPAFSARIRRLAYDVERKSTNGHLPTERRIPGESRVPLLFLWHVKAPYAREASRYFEDPRVDLRIHRYMTHPDGALVKTAEDIATLLIEQGRSKKSGVPCQIVHIHAHGLTGEESIHERDRLVFAYEQKKRLLDHSREVMV
jgi:hypothetical protein